MTQRQLEGGPPDGPSRSGSIPPAEPEPPRTEARAAAADPAAVSREPSELGLRSRQLRWLKERARFEARSDGVPAPTDESK